MAVRPDAVAPSRSDTHLCERRAAFRRRLFPTVSWKTRSAGRKPPQACDVVLEVIAEYVENNGRLPAERLRLVDADDPQRGPVLFGVQDRRLPLRGQVLEVVGIE
jgi:hypothetical protein